MRNALDTTPFELAIHDLDEDGRGVGRLGERVIFVKGALPGEHIRAKRIRQHRRFDEAEVLDVLRAAPERSTPRCAHFNVCSGCTLQHLTPAAQLERKQAALLEQLKRLGGVSPERVLPPLSGPEFGYRRRARLSVKRVDKKGKTLVGFREGDGRFVADLSSCPVLVPVFGERLAALGQLVDRLSRPAAIVQAEVAAGDDGAAMILRHVEPLSDKDKMKLTVWGAEAGIAIWLQPAGPDSVAPLSPDAGPLRYELDDGALSLRFGPQDFVQVNADLNRRMIALALELLAPQPGERIADLFCGLGNFTLPLARRGAEVIGIEGDAGLIERARANAAAHGLSIDWRVANLFDGGQLAALGDLGVRALLLDPPRAGAAEVVSMLPLDGVERIVYVSCHPGTLARDAGTLVRERGYRLIAAGVMDMFPHTSHVESIALFQR
ncbi:MAG: 23S rRNA (uracil(1939)-C(5))-methyltransferase RlmD [Xanthomonadales bacterium]|jgi:23S rRNA (uracil1939-C5)-methyltransferase|nr:23S rRNA (uracil(1939)-C(5))-methyltransferase RlmD [Xanthomonadales bacterium]